MLKNIIDISTVLIIAITLLIGLTSPALALAATAPALGTTNTYGIVSSTFTNSLNTALETTVVGDVCYTTGPATAPVSITGATVTPCANGADQANALSSLNSQSCTSLGTNVILSGTYTPGCYSSSGSMDIALSSTVTLSGAGVYVFKSGGALTTGANSVITLTNGATASNVFWAPVGAATIGANANSTSVPTFIGTIIDDAGVTIGHFANILGRILSFGGTVTTDSNTITVPPPVAVGPVFIDTNVNGILDSGEQSFNTIQEAITAAVSGDTIVIGAGTYTVTASMAVSKTLTLQGDGSYPKIFFNVGGGASNNIFNVTANNVIFKNLEIYSPVSTNGTRSNYAITFSSGSDLLVDDVKFHDLRRGVYVFNGNNFTIQNSQFSAFNRGMIEVSGGTGPFTITRNWFHDSTYLGGSTSAILTYRDNFVGGIGEISYNYIEGTRVAILYVPSTVNAPTSGSLLISHNTIDNTWTSTDSYYNTNVLTPSYNLQGIAIYDPTGHGINSSAIAIKDNIIANTRWYGTHYNGGTVGILSGDLPIGNSVYWGNYWDAAVSGESPVHYANEWSGTVTLPQIAWQGGTGGGSITASATTKTLDPLFVGGVKTLPSSYYALGPGSPACNSASDGQNMGAWQGTCSMPPSPAILHVIKLVVNGSGGTGPGVLHDSDFLIHVRNAGVDVSAAQPGAAAPGTVYSLSAGTYTVNEDVNNSYVKSYSIVGGCDQNGSVTLAEGENKTCTVVNTDIPLPAPVVVSSRATGSNYNSAIIVPLVGIMKAPSPLNLPGGPGSVTYNYIIWNVGGQKALTNITVTDDKCAPVTYHSGDLNSDNKLDVDEKWNYSCTTILSKTTTNTATVTGYSDDSYHQASIAAITATVAVGASTSTPLISIVKVPNRLTPLPFGGGNVIYTYAVTNPGVSPVNNVKVTDDKCTQVIRTSGDVNNNNLLDSSETWIYTCQANVAVSTRSIAMAEGRANGFYALGYGFATVLVSSPLFPETGSPQNYGEAIKMINVNLVKGSHGNDVRTLQEFLIAQGVGTAAQALKSNGTTIYFGPLTKAALAEWQKIVGIYPPIGNFGPITRAYLKTH